MQPRNDNSPPLQSARARQRPTQQLPLNPRSNRPSANRPQSARRRRASCRPQCFGCRSCTWHGRTWPLPCCQHHPQPVSAPCERTSFPPARGCSCGHLRTGPCLPSPCCCKSSLGPCCLAFSIGLGPRALRDPGKNKSIGARERTRSAAAHTHQIAVNSLVSCVFSGLSSSSMIGILASKPVASAHSDKGALWNLDVLLANVLCTGVDRPRSPVAVRWRRRCAWRCSAAARPRCCRDGVDCHRSHPGAGATAAGRPQTKPAAARAAPWTGFFLPSTVPA